jgi:hypothetical protein
VPLLLLFASTARAERSERQAHEVGADVDITLAEQSNAALIVIQYMWTPETLERYDEVVPALRRFVRHPSALVARFRHDGGTLDTRSALEGGGTLHLLEGRLYASGLGGIERDQVHYNFEDVYWTTPFTVEAGARPLELLSAGGYYRGRPIISATAGDVAFPSFRDGMEHELGFVLQTATPGDQLLASLRGGYYLADWDYTGQNPGPLDVKGWRAQAKLSYQTSSTNSWTVNLLFRREDWDNGRLGEDFPDLVGEDVERRVTAFEGDLGFQYWFRGTLGFRVTVGGGFETEPPIYYETFRVGTRGFGRFGFGFIKRL